MSRVPRLLTALIGCALAIGAASRASAAGIHRHHRNPQKAAAAISPTPTARRTPDGKIYPLVLITGGIGTVDVPTGESPSVLDSAEVYNPAIRRFLPLAHDLTSHRDGQAAVRLKNGQVLVAGGVDTVLVPLVAFSGPSPPSILDSTDLFDPSAGTFFAGARMEASRSEPTATLLHDGKVLVVGGSTDAAELYDPATGRFIQTGPMESPRYRQTATILRDGRVLIVGGGDRRAELYDPKTRKFTYTGAMNGDRIFHTATLLNNGKVLIAGGSQLARGMPLNTTELYDPVTGAFTAGPRMAEDRAGQTATLLQDGRVLIAGGHGDNSAEIYDPKLDVFTPAKPMEAARYGHTATLLADGTVLLAGGWDTEFRPLPSAEIYSPATGEFSAVDNMTLARADHTATLIWMKRPIEWLKPTPTPAATATAASSPTATVTASATPIPSPAPTQRPPGHPKSTPSASPL